VNDRSPRARARTTSAGKKSAPRALFRTFPGQGTGVHNSGPVGRTGLSRPDRRSRVYVITPSFSESFARFPAFGRNVPGGVEEIRPRVYDERYMIVYMVPVTKKWSLGASRSRKGVVRSPGHHEERPRESTLPRALSAAMSATTSGSADPASSSGDDPTLRAPTVPGADVVGAEAAKGTCHNCGGSMARGNVELAKMCGACGTRFHASDCGGAPRRRAVSEGTRGRRARGRLPPPVTRAPTRRRARGVALPPTISSTGGVIGRRGGRSAFAMFHASNATSRSRARATARRGGVFRARSIAPGPALARPTSRAVPGTSARERVAPSPGPVTPPREEKYPQTPGSGFGSFGRIATRIRFSASFAVVRLYFSSDSRPPSSRGLVRRPDET
jgi:hypothetical protein